MTRYVQARTLDPFQGLLGVQRDLNRVFDRALSSDPDAFLGSWAPRMDIHESQDAFTVWMDVPGLSSDDVQVTLDRNLLSIRGQRRFSEEHKEESFHRIERRYGQFERTVTLPATVDADGISASVDNGVLEITIPKAPEAKPRQIKVGTASKQIEG